MLPPADTRHVSDFLYRVMHFSPYASPSTAANTMADEEGVPTTAGGNDQMAAQNTGTHPERTW